MRNSLIPIFCLLAILSIGFNTNNVQRSPSSQNRTRHLTSQEIDHKLQLLYFYQVIELKSIKRPYANERTLAKKRLSDDLYNELLQNSRRIILKDKLQKFAKKSKLRKLSVEHLLREMEIMTQAISISEIDIANEIKSIQYSVELSVLEQNIEHLSHIIRINSSQSLNASIQTPNGNCSKSHIGQALCKL